MRDNIIYFLPVLSRARRLIPIPIPHLSQNPLVLQQNSGARFGRC